MVLQADAQMDRLETSKLDGTARVALLEQVLHPFGLTQVTNTCQNITSYARWRGRCILYIVVYRCISLLARFWAAAPEGTGGDKVL